MFHFAGQRCPVRAETRSSFVVDARMKRVLVSGFGAAAHASRPWRGKKPMFINVFAMPEVPGTLDERKALRPIGKRTDRYQMMLDELRGITKLCDQAGVHSFSMTEHHFHTEGGEA